MTKFHVESIRRDTDKKRKVLLLGTCTMEAVTGGASGRIQFDHYLFESYRHSPMPSVNFEEYDAIVVQPTLRHLFHQASFPREGVKASDVAWTRLNSEEEAAAYIQSCGDALASVMEKFTEIAAKRRVLFFSIVEPHRNYLGDLLSPYSLMNPASIVREINKRMSEETCARSGFHFVDINDILSAKGRENIHDGYTSHMSHASYMYVGHDSWDSNRVQGPMCRSELYDVKRGREETIPALGERISDVLDVLEQRDQVKIIIVDLDDTLWRGIAADEDKAGWEFSEGWPLGFVEALLVYKKRGGLLAICSKNDHAFIEGRFEHLVSGVISLSDFASVKINFDPKSKNISEILSEVNLLPENALFIDDNPREIDEVKNSFPTLRTLSKAYFGWREFIISSPTTQVSTITNESANRTTTIRAKILRDTEEKTMSRDEWLAALQVRCETVVIDSVEHENFSRAFELLNKTNQFNTTGRRWSLGEAQDLFGRDGRMVAMFVRDKHVDNGLVGLALVCQDEFIQTVLSCRVFNLDVELYLGHIVLSEMLSAYPSVHASFVDTGRNKSSFDYYDRLGFAKLNERYETNSVPQVPEWINAENN
ncbi:HAD-IIIC family phosphatase [Paraburkholderia ferrariae]|uniref:HAD-IIIC family phosphatase n=1 Tax=Paraburkholderia ferrariae TaxID=386056 RepID=UPI0006936B7B|nr:HAD-IIIC family phosphatase [Paraburkholderia ferrariae]